MFRRTITRLRFPVLACCAVMFASCAVTRHHALVRPPMCLPAGVTAERLVGDVVASHAIQPGISSVLVQTTHGKIALYWNGETLIGIDLEPDNKQTPLWMREPGEPCQWHYGQGKET